MQPSSSTEAEAPGLGLHPGERVQAPAVRPVWAPDGTRARPLPLPELPLHPALLRLVRRGLGSGHSTTVSYSGAILPP